MADVTAVIDKVAAAYSDHDQARMDGLTVDCGDWWFNLRPSNTEPVVRLNLEARSRERMVEERDRILARMEAAA